MPGVSDRLILELEKDLSRGVSARRWRAPLQEPLLATRASAHESIEVAFIESGVLRYRVGRRELVAQAGDIVVIPADVEHETDVMTAMKGGTLKVESTVLHDVAEALSQKVCLSPIVFTSVEVTSLARLVTESQRGLASADRFVQASLCDAIVARVVEAIASTTPDVVDAADVRVRAAIAVIHDRFREPLTVDEIARAAGLSRYHLSRLVKAATGRGPYELLLDVRLAEAARLLRTRDIPITNAALDAGFTDLSRFTVHFKRVFAMTPSAYARGHKQRHPSKAASTTRVSSSSTRPSPSRS
jgi:AraC-like DNA-binding protein